MANSFVNNANEISASKIYNFLQTNHITNEIFLEILSEIKDKNGYKQLKKMIMDLISTHKNALHNPATERSKRASIINEICMIAFTIDTVFPSVLRMKVQQEFPKLINDILYELKDEKKIDNFVPYPGPHSSVSTADENSAKTSLATVNTSSPNSDSNKMSYEEKDSALRCIASSLNPDAMQNKFTNEIRTRFQTIQDVRNAYKNVAKKRVTGSVASFISKSNIGNLNSSDNSMQLQCITQEDHSGQSRIEIPVGNENDCVLVESSTVHLKNKKKRKKELKIKVSKSNQKLKQLAKLSKKHEGRLKKKERLRLKQKEQLQILKKKVEEKEASDDSPVFTFFKSIAQTVTQLPPNLIAETRVQMCKIISDIEARVLCKKS